MFMFSTTARYDPGFDYKPYFFLLGCLAVGIILLAPLLFSRSIKPFFSFALLVVPAIPSFFPIETDTAFSHAFMVGCIQIWMICLLGTVALIIVHCERQLFAIGCHTGGLGITMLALGACLGALVFTPDWWRELTRPENPSGSIYASLIGLTSTVLVYISTNLLVNATALRDTVAIARGHIPANFAIYADVVDDEQYLGDQKLKRTCYQVGADKGLSPRELEVFVLLAQGRSLKRIQDELVIAEGTIITHRNNIYRKLGVHNKQELLDMVL